ncbi:O-antigen ligase family protein [Winogradskyella pulchriflava]|uniref:O-antigen ligase family protein n=1 Tax=Winogradskyella pulchriflava TaxID=1110688 RepID=A0ABV6QCJ1_9FLAO
MDNKYIFKILLHIGLGAMLYFINIFPKLFFYGVIVYFLFQIIVSPKKDKITEVLKACAYLVGAEVIFRMTNAGIFYESSKYFVIIFVLFGMFYNGVSNKSYPYFLYLICLVPSIIVAGVNIDFDSNLRTNVAFVLSGPVCLGISTLYCYNKKISLKQLLDVLLYLALPIVSLTTYLFFYSPSIKSILSGTQSNFAASGGFGPNQVATTLGLGMFVFCVNYFLNSKTLTLKIINVILFGAISFRGIVTFSRGGVITAIIMIIAFLFVIYSKTNWRQKNTILTSLSLLLVFSFAVWVISSNQTEGLIDKRYANQDITGKQKKDVSAGRVELFTGELEGFFNEPFVGVGASGMKEQREETLGRVIATHNELSRLLSEHGILGVIILLILIIHPLVYRAKNKSNYFFYACLAFWFATINHSAMRIAAPGFIYALALLNIRNEKRSLHRKRVIQ